MKQHVAFSLVELSIVLVILGLLVGGILAGQSLIRAGELRSVMAEITAQETAMSAFRDKYMAIPGDFTQAYAFWGAACANDAGASSAAICNGDGDGQLDWSYLTPEDGDGQRFYAHLRLAGMLEGKPITATNNIYCNPGVNAPASKAGGGYSVDHVVGFGNYLMYGMPDTPTNGGPCDNPILKPEEMWKIDQKMDDGYGATGRVFQDNVYPSNGCLTGAGATYNLASSAKRCVLFYKLPYQG